MQKYAVIPLVIALGLGLQACSSSNATDPAAASAPAKVSILTVQPQAIGLSENLPARVQAYRIAEIRPQVAGIIEKVLFTQGSEVKAGQALFKINADTFEADVQQNQAALSKAEAEVARLKIQQERFQQLLPSNAISKQELNDVQAQYRQALADVAQMKAALNRQTLNLQYATVRAPISGRIGKLLVTEGALVSQADSNALAVVQQIDRVYVDVKQSWNDYERLQGAIASGELSASRQQVQILNSQGLAYPVQAKILFSDISIDPETGDATLRIEVDNSARKLLPGMYVRVNIQRAAMPQALLVPQQAVQYDSMGSAQVYVINAQGLAETRLLQLGQQYQQFYVVTGGLQAGDKVVVEGMERIQPKQKPSTVAWQAPVSTVTPPTATTQPGATQPAAQNTTAASQGGHI